MTDTENLTVDSRAASRLVFFGLLAVGVLLLAGVFLFSGVFLDGGGDASEPTDESDGAPEPPADDTSNESDGGGSENGTTVAPPEQVDVTFTVWEQERGEEFPYYNIRLENETGAVVEDLGVGSGPSYTFEDLSYNDTYTVVAEAGEWPAKRLEFRAGAFESKDLIVGYDFQGADSFRWSVLYDMMEVRTEELEVKGIYADTGDADYHLQRLNPDYSDAGEVGYVTIGNITHWVTDRDKGTYEPGIPGWGYPDLPLYDPLHKGLGVYEERRFLGKTQVQNRHNLWVGEKTANRTLDKFKINISSQYTRKPGNMYKEATVYVDPRTGHTVRIQSDHLVYAAVNQDGKEYYIQPGKFIMDFYDFNHDDDISKDDLDLIPP